MASGKTQRWLCYLQQMAKTSWNWPRNPARTLNTPQAGLMLTITLSIGNIHNNVCWTHHDGLVLLGFLPIPKSMCSVVRLLSLLLTIDRLKNMLMMENSANFNDSSFTCHSLKFLIALKILWQHMKLSSAQMDIITELFSLLVLILVTIWSKYYQLTLCSCGVPSESCLLHCRYLC